MNHELRDDATILFSNDEDSRSINLSDEKIFNECLMEVFNLK